MTAERPDASADSESGSGGTARPAPTQSTPAADTGDTASTWGQHPASAELDESGAGAPVMRLYDENQSVVAEAKVPPIEQVITGWVSAIVHGDATLADVEPRPYQFNHKGGIATAADVDADALRATVADRLARHDGYDGPTEVPE